MANAFMKSWRRGFGISAVLLLVVAGGHAQTTLIKADFIQADWDTHYLNGTTYGLSTNLPGGNWIWGAGWDWGQPLSAQWDIAGMANLAEEKTALGLSIVSAGSYVKPKKARISATFYFPESRSVNTGGLGFWSTMPLRDNSKSATENFTGLVVDQVNGTIQVYAAGSPSGSAVSVGSLSVGVSYAISYLVDTVNGTLSEVLFNSTPVDGLSSTAFTDSATTHAGVLSGGSSRLKFGNLVVQSNDLPPKGTLITVQ